jgi:hypothetical protein
MVGRVGIEPTTKRLRAESVHYSAPSYTLQHNHIHAQRCGALCRFAASSVPPVCQARRLGVILKRMAETGERHDGRNAPNVLASRGATPTTLADLGIPRDRASRAMQLADVTRRAVGYARPMRVTSRAPCDDCRHRAVCGASGLVCRAFDSYTRGGSHWQRLARVPGKRITARIRKHHAAAVLEEAEEVRRREKRVYMAAWRARNGERVRARERARYERLKATAPEKLARIRAYQRAWVKAHPEAARRSSKRWQERNIEKVRAARRRAYHANPQASAALNRAYRETHRERVREIHRAWHALRREEVSARRRERYAKNRERILAANRKWRAGRRAAGGHNPEKLQTPSSSSSLAV